MLFTLELQLMIIFIINLRESQQMAKNDHNKFAEPMMMSEKVLFCLLKIPKTFSLVSKKKPENLHILKSWN